MAEEDVKVDTPPEAPPGDVTESGASPEPDGEFSESGASPEPPGVTAVETVDETEPPAGNAEIPPYDDGGDDRPPEGLIDENVEIPADQELKIVGEADPAEGLPDVPPLPNDVPPGGAQPIDPSPADDSPVEPPTGEVAPEAPGYEPPTYEAPAADVDLPDLYEAPPRYATGSDGHAPATDADQPSTGPVDEPGYEAPEVPAPAAADYEPADADDKPIEVNAQGNGDGDDPGLLDQVADAVGDLWDDAKDVVT